MGDMRVHELAKEFGMENKEFLARLIDMKIPVKSHSSTLNDAFVARIRKQLEPELAEQAAAAEAERQAEAERKAVEERLQKEAIEAERRKAVKEERARRAKERAEKAELSAEPGPAGYDFLAEPVIEPFAGLADEALDDLLAPTPELASANGVLSAEPATAAALAGSTTEAVGTIDTQEAAEPVAVEAEVEPAAAEVVAAETPATEAPAAEPAAAVAPVTEAPAAEAPAAELAAAEPPAAPVTETVAEAEVPAAVALMPDTEAATAEPPAAPTQAAAAVAETAPPTEAGLAEPGLETGPEVGQPAQKDRPAKARQKKAGARKDADKTSPKAEPEAAAKPEQQVQQQVQQQIDQQAQLSAGPATETPDEQASGPAESLAAEPGAAAKPEPKAAPTLTPAPRFTSLLSQIEAENQRLAAERDSQAAAAAAEAAAAPSRKSRSKGQKAAEKTEAAAEPATTLPVAEKPAGGTKTSSRSRKRAASETDEETSPRSRGRGTAQKRSSRPSDSIHAAAPVQLTADYADYDDALDKAEEDRYRRMAVAAEQFQRSRVLAEARAAVEAASNEGEGRRKKRKEKREAEAKEKIEMEAIERGIDPELLAADVAQVTSGLSVGELAEALQIPANDIVKRLFLLGMMMTVTQSMSDDLVELIALDLGRKVRIVSPEEEYTVTIYDAPDDLEVKPPVITVMGHVDHGKTSLLDAIRSTGVVATEAGGITQHIGASVANINGRQITFIDTPGHEAFTAMRARGAKVTDVVVLVVAADDGVMPQTVEAINHANAAGVPIVVAINKIDRPDANPDRVRAELAEHGIISEDWGGKNMFVEVSAKERLGIDDLLETILLQADVLELTANPKAQASGFVIEAKLDKGRGPVATVLVQRGTLHVGEMLVAGTSYGRVRALINPQGQNVDSASPADPVEVQGLGSVPDAGDEFRVFADERDARNLAEDRALRKRLAEQRTEVRASLEDLFARIESGTRELNLVVKADVQGSIEALNDALGKMDQSEVRINVIHSAVGGITETDVTLAAASDAIIIGFNVRPQPKARDAAEREKVEIKTYRVIYQAIDDINAARIGMLKPEMVEEETGIAEVREIYRVPKVGNIAGCFVDEGEISFDDSVRIVRDGTVVFEGSIISLRHYRDDVRSVRSGTECGIGIADFQDIKVGDSLEAFRIREVVREA